MLQWLSVAPISPSLLIQATATARICFVYETPLRVSIYIWNLWKCSEMSKRWLVFHPGLILTLRVLTLRHCIVRSLKTSTDFNGGVGIVREITKQFHVCVIFSSRTVVHRWHWQLSKAPLDTRNFTRSFQPAVLRRADTTAETVTKSFVHYNEDHWFFCQLGSTRLLLQICHRHLCWCITVSSVFHT